MIIKSLTRKSGTRQLLNYLFKKEEKLFTNKQKPIVIRHNMRNRTIDKMVKEFDKNETYRLRKRVDNVKVYHTILSFSSKDKELITEKMIKDIAKQYMKLREDKNLFVGTAHFDKDHIHIHLVMSGTKYLTGESNRLSRAQFHQLKLSMDEYQRKKFPELINSLPRHGRSKEKTEKNKQINNAGGRLTQKETLMKTLESVYAKSKSLDDFLAKLRSNGHEPYYRGKDKRLQGIKFEGDRKFRLTTIGYQEKVAQLSARQIKEEKTLSELRDLREGRTSGREQSDSRESISSEKDVEGKDEGVERIPGDDIDKGDHMEEDDEQITDDNDDLV
ncbi:MAG: relaxase/mobilization nuclease domain-containing protein [Bacillota bacterium]|nr:relaxase/mobilization nuclease domain-containing protein [Bacillota bacterium]